MNLQSISNYLLNLSVRERILVLLVAIAVIYAAWDGLLLSQQEENYQILVQQQKTLDQEKEEREQALINVTEKISAQQRTIAEKKQEIIQVTHELEQIELELDAVFGKLVPPAKITELLRSLLLKTSGLELLELGNGAVEQIIISNESSGEKQEQQNNPIEQISLYKHSTTLKLTGNYQQLYRYLSTIQESDWNLYWNELHYAVTEYPKAEITLRVHTISTDAHWIGL